MPRLKVGVEQDVLSSWHMKVSKYKHHFKPELQQAEDKKQPGSFILAVLLLPVSTGIKYGHLT